MHKYRQVRYNITSHHKYYLQKQKFQLSEITNDLRPEVRSWVDKELLKSLDPKIYVEVLKEA